MTIVRLLTLVISMSLLGACSGKDGFLAKGIGKGAADADHVAEPNAMAKGPGLLSGKKGGWEIYAEDEDDSVADPKKPRRVKRRRR